MAGILPAPVRSRKRACQRIKDLTQQWHASRDAVPMTLIGGVVMVVGLVMGAFPLVAIQHSFAKVGAWVTIIQGTIFVACVLTFSQGIVEELRECWQRRDRQKPDVRVDPRGTGQEIGISSD
jgi:branched-chain amino acid transport system permease protein